MHWSEFLVGGLDKMIEAGCVVVGGSHGSRFRGKVRLCGNRLQSIRITSGPMQAPDRDKTPFDKNRWGQARHR